MAIENTGQWVDANHSHGYSTTWNGPVQYGSNTGGWASSSATTYTIKYDGPPARVTLDPHPTQHRYLTEVEQLLADVESVCVLGR